MENLIKFEIISFQYQIIITWSERPYVYSNSW